MLLVGITLGAVLMLFGVVAGSAWTITHYEVEHRKRKALETRPICGCHHHVSYHRDLKGSCHWNNKSMYENNVCGCQQYVGPEVSQ